MCGVFFLEVSNIKKCVKKGLISGVKEESIAEELGLKKGDRLIKINNEELYDILDYKFNEVDEYVELEIEHENGEVEIYEIEKYEEDELGIIFENELIDNPRNCHNKCIFCFMEQLPKNVRDTLVFKDDDYRLSFFSGNYITLTNMKDFDIDRIIKYRMSPINISIHATDEKTRCMMLNNRFAGKVLKYLDRLIDSGINVNTQIVLCKGINDGKILEKTIKDLSKYAPTLKSICIVPVGLSNNREGLYPLLPLEKKDCKEIIEMVRPYQKQFIKKYKTPLVFLADEFYLKAKEKFPSYSSYGEFGQLEDGIGMTPLFEHDFKLALKEEKEREEKNNEKSEIKNITKNITEKRTVTLITGKIVEEYMNKKIKEINKVFPNIKVNVIAPINRYFGEQITVTGLLTGRDIINTLKTYEENNIDLGEYIIMPRVMLKDDEDIFLDDTLLTDLQKKLNKKIVITDGTAKTFIHSICHNNSKKKIYKYAEEETKHSYENSIKNI